jgi:small conductance mechanosensitive channel
MNWDWNKIYDRVYNWLLTYGPRILAAIVVLLIGLWLIRILNRWIKKGLMRHNFNPSLRYFLQNFIAISLQIILIIMVMQIAGIQLTFFTAIIAGLSVAAGLALSGTLQNFVSGILILVLRPYRVGENISTQGQEGAVTSIQLFYTTVLTFDNKTIIIPNGQLSNNVVINLSREGKRRMDIELKLSYGLDIEHVKQVILKSVKSAQNILPHPECRVVVSKLEADKYTLLINVWVNAHGFYDTMFQLNEKIIKDMISAGLKLPGME